MALPILASVPHAGLQVPSEAADRCLLTPVQIAEDGDEHAPGEWPCSSAWTGYWT